MIKKIEKVLIVLMCVMSPALCVADDYNYDDDTNINVSEDNWDNPGGNVNVEIDGNDISGIGSISTGNIDKTIHVELKNGCVVINASKDGVVPVYRIGSPAINVQRVNCGVNMLSLPSGIYVINGRKYKIQAAY